MYSQAHNTGYRQELTAVSGFCIQEDAAGVDLVGIEVKATHDFVAGDERGDTWGVRGAFRQVIDHPPGTATGEKSGEKMVTAVLSA